MTREELIEEIAAAIFGVAEHRAEARAALAVMELGTQVGYAKDDVLGRVPVTQNSRTMPRVLACGESGEWRNMTQEQRAKAIAEHGPEGRRKLANLAAYAMIAAANEMDELAHIMRELTRDTEVTA